MEKCKGLFCTSQFLHNCFVCNSSRIQVFFKCIFPVKLKLLCPGLNNRKQYLPKINPAIFLIYYEILGF